MARLTKVRWILNEDKSIDLIDEKKSIELKCENSFIEVDLKSYQKEITLKKDISVDKLKKIIKKHPHIWFTFVTKVNDNTYKFCHIGNAFALCIKSKEFSQEDFIELCKDIVDKTNLQSFLQCALNKLEGTSNA